MDTTLTLVRDAVIAAVALAALAALASWLVRTRKVSPFSAAGRGLRGFSDPFIRPVENRLVRMGGNPVHAGAWLVVGAMIAGLLVITAVEWVLRAGWDLRAAFRGGPLAIARLAVLVAYNVLFVALIVRVVGSWLGVGRFTRWMRPAYTLTDWIVEPLRRVLPPFGQIDLSPLAALVVLWVLRQFLLVILFR